MKVSRQMRTDGREQAARYWARRLRRTGHATSHAAQRF